MPNEKLPIAFMAALVQDKRAMQNFAHLNDGERSHVLLRVQKAKTRADMQLIADSLSDAVSAVEYH